MGLTESAATLAKEANLDGLNGDEVPQQQGQDDAPSAARQPPLVTPARSLLQHSTLTRVLGGGSSAVLGSPRSMLPAPAPSPAPRPFSRLALDPAPVANSSKPGPGALSDSKQRRLGVSKSVQALTSTRAGADDASGRSPPGRDPTEASVIPLLEANVQQVAIGVRRPRLLLAVSACPLSSRAAYMCRRSWSSATWPRMVHR